MFSGVGSCYFDSAVITGTLGVYGRAASGAWIVGGVKWMFKNMNLKIETLLIVMKTSHYLYLCPHPWAAHRLGDGKGPVPRGLI